MKFWSKFNFLFEENKLRNVICKMLPALSLLNAKQKLKEHILMNDISHLYGGTR